MGQVEVDTPTARDRGLLDTSSGLIEIISIAMVYWYQRQLEYAIVEAGRTVCVVGRSGHQKAHTEGGVRSKGRPLPSLVV